MDEITVTEDFSVAEYVIRIRPGTYTRRVSREQVMRGDSWQVLHDAEEEYKSLTRQREPSAQERQEAMQEGREERLPGTPHG